MARPQRSAEIKAVHDPRFIPPGYPGAGNVTIYNNFLTATQIWVRCFCDTCYYMSKIVLAMALQQQPLCYKPYLMKAFALLPQAATQCGYGAT